MEIKVLEKTKTKLEIEVGGEDHTLCNAIREELNYDSKVKAASYKIDHPLTAKPVMVIHSAEPKKALESAVKRAKKKYAEFGAGFKKC